MKLYFCILTVVYFVYFQGYNCPSDYYGNNCTTHCAATNTCDLGHFICDSVTGNKVCLVGWMGDNCDKRRLPQHLDIACPAKLTCKNGGQCFNGACCCRDHYSGQFCNIETIGCHSNPCLNGGRCVPGIGNDTDNYTCECVDTFQGQYCERQSTTTNGTTHFTDYPRSSYAYTNASPLIGISTISSHSNTAFVLSTVATQLSSNKYPTGTEMLTSSQHQSVSITKKATTPSSTTIPSNPGSGTSALLPVDYETTNGLKKTDSSKTSTISGIKTYTAKTESTTSTASVLPSEVKSSTPVPFTSTNSNMVDSTISLGITDGTSTFQYTTPESIDSTPLSFDSYSSTIGTFSTVSVSGSLISETAGPSHYKISTSNQASTTDHSSSSTENTHTKVFRQTSVPNPHTTLSYSSTVLPVENGTEYAAYNSSERIYNNTSVKSNTTVTHTPNVYLVTSSTKSTKTFSETSGPHSNSPRFNTSSFTTTSVTGHSVHVPLQTPYPDETTPSVNFLTTETSPGHTLTLSTKHSIISSQKLNNSSQLTQMPVTNSASHSKPSYSTSTTAANTLNQSHSTPSQVIIGTTETPHFYQSGTPSTPSIGRISSFTSTPQTRISTKMRSTNATITTVISQTKSSNRKPKPELGLSSPSLPSTRMQLSTKSTIYSSSPTSRPFTFPHDILSTTASPSSKNTSMQFSTKSLPLSTNKLKTVRATPMYTVTHVPSNRNSSAVTRTPDLTKQTEGKSSVSHFKVMFTLTSINVLNFIQMFYISLPNGQCL